MLFVQMWRLIRPYLLGSTIFAAAVAIVAGESTAAASTIEVGWLVGFLTFPLAFMLAIAFCLLRFFSRVIREQQHHSQQGDP